MNYMSYVFGCLLLYNKSIMKNFFLYIVILLTLASCWWKEDLLKTVNFWGISFNISNNFSQVKDYSSVEDYKVLDVYNTQEKTDVPKASLILLEYKGPYPQDEKEFFTIVSDKFQRQIPGVNILKKSRFKKKDNTVYYFTYEVFDDLFANDNTNPNYYGLQAYVFNNKKVYTISYMSSSKKATDTMLSNIKNLNTNK